MNKFPKHPPLTRWQSLGLHAFVLLPVLGVLVALLNGISMQTIVSIAVGVPLAMIFIGIPVALGLGIFFTLLGKAFIYSSLQKKTTPKQMASAAFYFLRAKVRSDIVWKCMEEPFQSTPTNIERRCPGRPRRGHCDVIFNPCLPILAGDEWSPVGRDEDKGVSIHAYQYWQAMPRWWSRWRNTPPVSIHAYQYWQAMPDATTAQSC